MTDKWKLPDTPEKLERAMDRFRVAGEVLREVNEWLDRKGSDPPECITFRANEVGMSVEDYYIYWKSFGFLDPRATEEENAIEDRAIHAIQPEWKRNPNRRYPQSKG